MTFPPARRRFIPRSHLNVEGHVIAGFMAQRGNVALDSALRAGIDHDRRPNGFGFPIKQLGKEFAVLAESPQPISK
jgi:hypothetical protein